MCVEAQRGARNSPTGATGAGQGRGKSTLVARAETPASYGFSTRDLQLDRLAAPITSAGEFRSHEKAAIQLPL